MACDCISRVEKLVKAQTNESGCLDTSIGGSIGHCDGECLWFIP